MSQLLCIIGGRRASAWSLASWKWTGDQRWTMWLTTNARKLTPGLFTYFSWEASSSTLYTLLTTHVCNFFSLLLWSNKQFVTQVQHLFTSRPFEIPIQDEDFGHVQSESLWSQSSTRDRLSLHLSLSTSKSRLRWLGSGGWNCLRQQHKSQKYGEPKCDLRSLLHPSKLLCEVCNCSFLLR